MRPLAGPRAATLLAAGALVVVLVGAACSSGSTGSTAEPADMSVVGEAGPAAATASSLCADAVASTVGTAPDALTEASGLVASRAHPGILWSHDDSGGAAELFALLPSGGASGAGRVAVTGAPALDWEDIALLPGVDGAADRLVIGDIGDNPGSGQRATTPARLVIVDEPAPPGAGGVGRSSPATVVAIAYPDGARDAETVLADPRTGDVFVVSKQWDGADPGLYRVPSVEPIAGPVTMERVASVGGGAALVTGGDISPDGSVVALRTYGDVRLWDRAEGETVADALARPPSCRVVVIEPQGEAVAFTVDCRGFVTLSEGDGAALLLRHLP